MENLEKAKKQDIPEEKLEDVVGGMFIDNKDIKAPKLIFASQLDKTEMERWEAGTN